MSQSWNWKNFKRWNTFFWNISKIEYYINILIFTESYLSRSVELIGEAKDLLQEKELTKEEISAIVSKICKKKEIINQTFKDKLNKILNKGNKIKKAKNELKALYKKNIKIEELQHKYMLLDLWKHFRPLDPIELIDKKWRK